MPSHLFVPTGTMETFVIPPHQPGTLRVTVAGARGGRYPLSGSLASVGGRGGSIRGYLDLPSGTNLSIAVGWMGEDGGNVPDVSTRPQGGGVAGWRGGNGGYQSAGAGDPSAWSGAGGGGTAVLLSGAPLIVAGGGGGGALKSSLVQGNEGGRGGLGISAGEYTAPTGQSGEGGQLDRPGVGGAPHSNLGANGNPGGDGSGGNGGNGADGHPGFATNNGAGAGGGGGYYGAGGSGGGWLNSTHGRGGGGSSWGDTTVLTGVDHVGYQGGDGYVLFEWEPRRHGRHLGLVRGSRGVG